MKKNVFGRKLSRDKEERKALFKSLMSSLIINESIKTTEAKAKSIKADVEKLITKAKRAQSGDLAVLHKSLTKTAFDRIIKEVGPRFAKRQGGYTRIIKLGERFGDDAPYVIIELVEKKEVVALIKTDKKVKTEPKAAKEKTPVKKEKREVKTKAKK